MIGRTTQELAVDADVDLRVLLEHGVMGRCTLTVGDEVWVTHGEKEYALKVVEVQPDDAGGAVSLIETDIEVDIAPSQDYEEAMRRLAENERKRLTAAAEAGSSTHTTYTYIHAVCICKP